MMQFCKIPIRLHLECSVQFSSASYSDCSGDNAETGQDVGGEGYCLHKGNWIRVEGQQGRLGHSGPKGSKMASKPRSDQVWTF